MIDRESFDDVLDQAIGALADGEALASVLGRYPGHAAMLRPLLESASALMALAARGAPAPRRLDWNTSALPAALRDRRGAWRGVIAALSPLWSSQAPRRFALASLSIPSLAIAAIAVVGTGSVAAAALVATQPELRQRVADLAADNLHLSSDSGANETPASTGTSSTGAGVSPEVPAAAGTSGGRAAPTTTSRGPDSPGNSASSSRTTRGAGSGAADAPPGRAGDGAGNSGDAPGQSGSPHGHSGEAPGQNKTNAPNAPTPGDAAHTPPPESPGNGPVAVPGLNGKGHANQ
jgi:hypothetical protein